MAKTLGHSVLSVAIEPYKPRCRRRSVHKIHGGQCRVFCGRVTDIGQLTSSGAGTVFGELNTNKFDDSVGVYFFRWADNDPPFVKIGQCSDRSVTAQHKKDGFGLGGHSHKTTPVYRELEKVSRKNPAYFVFYEMVTDVATPRVDEYVALGHHHTQFGRLTTCRASLPKYGTGASLVWHNPAFSEVLNKQFPSCNPYP